MIDIHLIRVISVVLEKHREPRLLRISFLLLYDLLHEKRKSMIDDELSLDELKRVTSEIKQYEILELTVINIQFISIDSDALISALNFLYTCSRFGRTLNG